MSSPDPRIDAYVAQAEPFARPILSLLRQLFHEAVPEVEESIRWRMPTFLLDGKQLGNMASFKAHCSLVIAPRSMEPILAADGFDATDGMGQFGKITARRDLPSSAQLKRYFKIAAQHLKSGAQTKSTLARKPGLPIPPDLAAALKLKPHAPAAATWQALSPGKKRDYLEWLADAKREATRTKRLATTLAWLAEGKARNWKYEKC